MKDQVNNENKNSIHWKSFFTGVAAALLLGAFYQFLINPCKGIDCKKIIAAIPAKYQNEKSAYILRSVEMNARLQGQLDAANNKSSLTKVEQDFLLNGNVVSSKGSKIQNVASSKGCKIQNFEPPNDFSSVNQTCCDTLTTGVRYDLTMIVNSIIRGQGVTTLDSSNFEDYGIFIRFICYPKVQDGNFPEIDSGRWNTDYALKNSALLNYTVKEVKTAGQETHRFIRKPGANPNSTDYIADDLGMVCPRHCPE